MTSPLAKEDLDILRAEGLAPSDEDVVRLHALALRISNGRETTAYTMPRFARAGGVVFWEPTMAARYWHEYAKTFSADDDSEDWLFAFACAKGREVGYLAALRDPDDIQRAVMEFVRTIAATKAEVDAAVYYATVGIEAPQPEKTDIAKAREKNETPDEREMRYHAELERTLTEAAASTGLTYNDLMLQTKSRLVAMIRAAHVEAGAPLSRANAKAHAEYLATLNAITRRLREEKAGSI